MGRIVTATSRAWLTATMDEPHLVGWGPVEFSTSLEVMPFLRIVWDVNGYYRELGVSPDVTRREIREAYQKKRGWRSPRLTFIMTQLLDLDIRDRYDRSPIGSMFIDEYVETFLRAKAAQEISEMRMKGLLSEAEFRELDLDPLDFFAEDSNLSDQGSIVITPEEWRWSYYLWGSDCDDKERLRQWQELLIGTLGEWKEHHQLAIGFVGNSNIPYEIRAVGYRKVVFLNDLEQPTEALAESASRVIANI